MVLILINKRVAWEIQFQILIDSVEYLDTLKSFSEMFPNKLKHFVSQSESKGASKVLHYKESYSLSNCWRADTLYFSLYFMVGVYKKRRHNSLTIHLREVTNSTLFCSLQVEILGITKEVSSIDNSNRLLYNLRVKVIRVLGRLLWALSCAEVTEIIDLPNVGDELMLEFSIKWVLKTINYNSWYIIYAINAINTR